MTYPMTPLINALTTTMRPIHVLPTCLLAVLLAGCGDDPQQSVDGSRVAGSSQDPLPRPEGASRGGVTGMPAQPGPGTDAMGLAGLPPDTPVDNQGNVLMLPDDALLAGAAGDGQAMAGDPGQALAAAGTRTPASATTTTTAPDEPSAQDALTVIRDYYGAIGGGRYARAYHLWSDGGRASGQSLPQFTAGFSDTVAVSIDLMDPGRVGAAVGSRYIEVPVAISSTLLNGSTHKYVGVYTLRRAVVDGASDEQRQWRIASADIREVQP